MLKFIRGKGQQPSAERQKLQNELFAFRKTVQHGFPHRASALAWDPLLRLAALGTATGALKVYGRPGVELYGQHTNPDSAVTQIHFIPGTGRLIALCDDNSLHLWEINEKSLVELKAHTFEGKNKKISSLCVESTGKNLLLGTEGGNIYAIDLNAFTVNEDVIYQDVVMQNCPEDFKVNPGAVESVCEHPKVPSRLLIGYNRGLVVLWDRVAASPTHTFVSNQQLESLCWNDDGEHFTSSHNDGSYVTWEVAAAASDRPLKEPVTPYGPYPCKAISKILTRTSVDGDEIVIYSGGMPRASYSDKYTVTVQQGEKHVAFDFTSRVIDFFTSTPVPPDGVPLQEDRPDTPAQIQLQTVNQVAAALVVLAEEELVVIDLCDGRWRPMRLPYLVSIHASAVTTAQLVDNVASNVYDNIVAAGNQQTENMYSEGAWPISGGIPSSTVGGERQVLLTGHEDGSVRFWDVSGVAMTPLYKYTTAQLFSGEEIGENNDSQNDEEEWPPFRRVGSFDPYSDDPRLAVKRVILCPLSGMLTIGGAAGHIVIASLKTTSNTSEVKSVSVNIVSDRDGFVWKGHDQLTLRSGALTFPQGYQVTSVVQISPPAAVTSLAAQWEWGVVCAGTAHGLALIDAICATPLLHKCTLNPHVTSLAAQWEWGVVCVGTAHGLALIDAICATPLLHKCTLNPHVTSLAAQWEWGVVCAGTAHGLALIDAICATPLLHKCTLNPHVTSLAAQWEWGVVCAGTAHGLALIDAICATPLLHKCTLNPHVTSLAAQWEWGVVCAGTAHGLALIDAICATPLLHKCTLNPHVTSLAAQWEWGVVCAGTAHGLALIDAICATPLLHKCTLNPHVTSLAAQWEWGVVCVGTAHGLALIDAICATPLLHKCTLNPHVTSLAAQWEWGVVCAGTAHGLALIDAICATPLLHKCTLNPHVTSLAAQWEWGVVCAGTAHGLALIDAICATPLLHKCTLNPHVTSLAAQWEWGVVCAGTAHGLALIDAICATPLLHKCTLNPHVTSLAAQWEWGVVCAGTAHGLALIDAICATPLLHKCTLNPHVTSLAAQWEWGVVCAGTAHGLALIDAICATPLLHKCTLNPHDHSGAGDTPISRRKSFKKSLRESFRRLRKGRSQRRQTTTSSPTSPSQPTPKKADKTAPAPAEGDVEIKPVERAVEARSTDDAFGSMVRCLYFARTFLINTQNSTPTLWAGTNNGTVYAFTINVPNTNKRKEEPLTCQLAKEIQLKHRAPVIGITVLDGAAVPLPDPLEVERGVSPLPEPGTHRVVITSEEQFKVFTLPSLKPHHKYKLTAHEGARVRRTAFAYFECGPEGERHREWCLLCLTNLGDCLVLSPELRRQLNAAAVRKEDINGISSLCFSKRGEALYLHSSSELQRITLSATKVTVAQCQVLLSPWAVALRGPEEAPLTNGDHREEVAEAAHDVTAASADITVDSVRDHTAQPTAEPELNINLQNSQVNTSSMVVKTTTRTTINENSTDGGTTTTTTTTNAAENILEHSREEGVITRIETGTVTVPAGTDPKLILEMFDRQRAPLSVPVPPAPTPAADSH
ncbi:hypothetical protein ABMA28_014771 [Loxostege sticticalis]|uniref:Lethal giant larvae homologue 2 domain-containing protein n=1 Tax=Loxostege sticticalis TaxID=481309 RepID=A0ABD0TD86_LOXSC